MKRGSRVAVPDKGLVDEMLDCYVTWREDAAAVADAYRKWSSATAGEAARRFSVYAAALDLEESSAQSYALVVATVERALYGSRSV